MHGILQSLMNDEKLVRNRFKKGEVLFREGQICRYVGIVQSGELSISSFDHHGNEVIFNIISSGGVFGNNLIFSSDPHYRGDVVASKDGEVILISREELLKRLQNDENFLLSYLAVQSDFGKELNSRIKLLSFDRAEDRLLYHLHARRGTFTYSSISSYARELNLKWETLSRLLSRLEKDGIIIRRRNRIKLTEYKEEV